MRCGRLAWFIPVLSLLAAPAGESIYLGQCAVCHGERGEGGRGPALARPTLRNAPDDDALFRVIRRGIPDSGMPGTALAEREIKLLIVHVRNLGRVSAPSVLPGRSSARRTALLRKGRLRGMPSGLWAGFGRHRRAP